VQQQYNKNTTTLSITNKMVFLHNERRYTSHSKGANASHMPGCRTFMPTFFYCQAWNCPCVDFEITKNKQCEKPKTPFDIRLEIFYFKSIFVVLLFIFLIILQYISFLQLYLIMIINKSCKKISMLFEACFKYFLVEKNTLIVLK